MVKSFRHRMFRLSITLGVSLISLTGCGGNGSMEPSGGGQPTGYLYVASAAASGNQSLGTVFEYSIASDGSLNALGGGSVPTGVGPVAVVSDSTGHYVYVFNQGDGTISQYSVGAGGVLVPLSPASISIGATLPGVAGSAVRVSSSGHSLYLLVTPRDPPGVAAPFSAVTSILQYAIGSGGALSPLNPASVGVEAVAGGPLAFDPNGTYAYFAGEPAGEAVSGDGAVLQFSIAVGGELTPLVSQTVAATHNALGVTFGPSGRTAYVLSACVDNACEGQIGEYSVGGNGMLTPTGATVTTGSHVIPISLVTDTSESSAYLLTNLMGVDTNQGAIYQYTINSGGALMPMTPASLGVSSGAVAQMVLGPNLYALSSNVVGFASGAPTGGHIDHYSIGNGGMLAMVGTTSVTGGYPTAMTVVAAH